MAKLSQRAWALLWITEGGNPSQADTYSAIVMAESGGDSNAQNSIGATGGPQILLSAHPDVSETCAKDPACSTRKAIQISNNGRDWSPWVTYTSGAYRSFIGGGGKRVSKRKAKTELAGFKLGPFDTHIGPNIQLIPGIGNAAEAGGNLLSSPGDILGTFKQLTAFFVGLGELILTPEGWLRMGKMIGGLVLALWGLRIIIKNSTGTDPVAAVKNTVEKAGEAAAIAATVK